MQKELTVLIKTYAGRYVNGDFVLPEIVKSNIPNNVRVIITVIDESILEIEKAPSINEHLAAEFFLNAMESMRLEGFSDEDNGAIDALQNGEYRPVFSERVL